MRHMAGLPFALAFQVPSGLIARMSWWLYKEHSPQLPIALVKRKYYAKERAARGS